MLEKIQNSFTESIQLQIAATELLPAKLEQAAKQMQGCLLRGNKIIVCGHGRSYGHAQLLVSHLLPQYELARPTLYAVQLDLTGTVAGVAVQRKELDLLYQKQLQAVYREGDIFVCFSPLGNEEAVLNAIHFAKGEGLDVIVFTSSHNEHTQGLLEEDDIEIAFPSINEAQINEEHLF
ncbi:MAG: SIS domain-containing protein, partial [Haemophilus parahaemolyticus]|uniref:D-sedoheptulose-7-phosphate isomerase n=1 Tax=Haemophilus parahaemolyticus TaxID=735 RepID=UPI0027F03549